MFAWSLGASVLASPASEGEGVTSAFQASTTSLLQDAQVSSTPSLSNGGSRHFEERSMGNVIGAQLTRVI